MVKERASKLSISLILIIYITAGAFYNISVPIFEAPDETGHYLYVRHLVVERSLPIRAPVEEGIWGMNEIRADQPPLYYALGALLTGWVDTTGVERTVRRSPTYGSAVPDTSPINKNRYIHTAQERFPYRGVALAVHLARGYTMLWGVVVLIFTYLLAREIFPARDNIALGAVALVAFTPQFIFLSNAVSPDVPVTAVSVIVLWICARILRRGANRQYALIIGILIGVGLLVKPSALLLLPLVALVYIIGFWQDESVTGLESGYRAIKRVIPHGIVIGAVTGAISGWWYVRNKLLYGEFLATTRMLSTTGGFRDPKPSLGELLSELRFVARSYWAVFGWANILVSDLFYIAVYLFVALAIIGALWRFVKDADQQRRIAVGMLLVWIGLNFSALLSYMRLTYSPYGRHLFPAMPAIAILLVWGLLKVLRRDILFWSVIGALGVSAPLLMCVYVRPAYVMPPILSPAKVGQVANRVSVNFDDELILRGYAAQVENKSLTLYWQARSRMNKDYSLFIHLHDEQGAIVGGYDVILGTGMFPTSAWEVNEVLREVYPLPSGDYIEIRIGVYWWQTQERLPATSGGQSLTNGEYIIVAREN